MASKKDLVEGQAFSRRRLITAFVSGAPGGREVEPGKPLRAVVGGVVLSALLCVGALAAGLLAPTLPDGWDQGSLVIAKDTGARYVALNGTLYPVLNTASARLLIPSGFKVVSADSDKLVNSKRGNTLGIQRAPDALPSPDALIDVWTACASQGGGLATSIAKTPVATEVRNRAVVVSVTTPTATSKYLIDNGIRYPISADLVEQLRRVLQLDTATVYQVTAEFLNLFPVGADAGPFPVPESGTPVAGVSDLPDGTVTGSVVHDANTPDRPYLLLANGAIAPLTPFADAMRRLDVDAGGDDDIALSSSVFAKLGRADPIWPSSWPTETPAPLGATPCAVMSTSTSPDELPSVGLGASSAKVADGSSTATVDAGAGSLVRSIGAASLGNGPVFLVDQTGVAFPVEGTSEEDPITKLGYSSSMIVPVPQAFLALLDTGPTLSVTAASTVVVSATTR